VVEDDVMAGALGAADDVEHTLEVLVEAANDAGGPDNITVVLVRYGPPAPIVPHGDGDAGAAAAATTDTSSSDGARPAADPVRIGTRTEGSDADWAGRLGNYGALSPGGGPVLGGHHDDGRRHLGRTLGKIVAVLVGVAILLGLALLGARFLLDRAYYVGLDGDDVVIYQGIDVDLGPVSLSRVAERTALTVDDIPVWYAQQLEDGRPAADLADARRIVEGAPRRDGTTDGADGTDDAGADDTASDP
jgi:PPM family protein phosphatase